MSKLDESGIKVGAQIGSGGFGTVYKGTKDGKAVAIKVMSKKVFKTKEQHDDMLREVAIMDKLKGHPNVVNIVSTFEDKSDFIVVMELADGGDVMSRIEALLKSSEHHFSEKVASVYFKQMLAGVKHCNDNLVVHRDLKPENFLLAAGDVIKVTDFGLSAIVKSKEEILYEACGSPFYIAPEILTGAYTIAVDAFALGVVLFIMLSGSVPFGANAADDKGILRSIQNDDLVFGPSWTGISAAAKELIAGLLEKDASKRYTIDEALAHPWVSGGAAPDTPISRAIVDSLLSYNAANKFKKQAVQMVAASLGAKDVEEMRTAFLKIDKDNSGFITRAELIEALSGLGKGAAGGAGVASGDFTALLASVDADGDGNISWEEFLAATVEAKMVKHQQQIWEAFNAFDKDGSGSITVDELRMIMKDEDPAKIEAYIKEYDTDKDGTINYEEFLRMMLPKNLKFKVTKA